MPILRRALKTVDANSPALADDIEAKLVDHGITKATFRLEGLLKAAELFNIKISFRIKTIYKKRIVVPQEASNLPKVIVKLARKNVEHCGIATVLDIAAQAQKEVKQPIKANFVIVKRNMPRRVFIDLRDRAVLYVRDNPVRKRVGSNTLVPRS